MARNCCSKCQHFTPCEKPQSLENFGQCALMISVNDEDTTKTDRVYPWDYEGYSAGAYVGKDFGCIHFERK